MTVRTTVYLSDGNNIQLTIYGKTIGEVSKMYTKALDRKIISHDGPKSIQLIPTEKIMLVDIEEVSDE